VKKPPLDRRPLEHGSFRDGEPVDSSCEKRLNGRRNGHFNSAGVVIPRVGEHLLDEERVSFCAIDNPLAQSLGNMRAAQKPLDESLRFLLGERFQRDRCPAQLGRRPRWA